MDDVDYTDTFITVAPDSTADEGRVPPLRAGRPTVASATHAMIAGRPYEVTSGDVIFGVWADRQGLAPDDRGAARSGYYERPRACLRSSDLGKRFGWGIHADGDGRLALYGVETEAYRRLAGGIAPDGTRVKVTAAMRSSRREAGG